MLKGMPLNHNLIRVKQTLMPFNKRVTSFVLLQLLFLASLHGQSFNIEYQWNHHNQAVLPKYFQHQHKIENESLLIQEIQKAKVNLASLGYFAADVNDTLLQGKRALWLSLGKKYDGIRLKCSPELLPWAPNVKKDSLLSLSEYTAFLSQTLAAFQANGYPFAAFRYEDFTEEKQSLSLSISMEKGRKMFWKELRIKGDSSLSVTTLEAELDFKPGQIFTSKKQEEILIRLNQLSYIQVIKPPEYQFSTDGVTLYLYIKGTKINSFNGAIGLQPNPISQKMGLTGDVQLKLVNALKKAEQVDFVWRSVKPATQLLTFRLAYPYLFHSSFGTEFKFNLYKRDSTFLELKSGLAIQYALSNALIVKGIYSLTSNNRLYASNNSLDFPNAASFRNTMFGLGFTLRTLDYLPNPTRGVHCTGEAYVGQRKSESDTLSSTPTNRISFAWEQYITIRKRFVLRYFLSFDTYNAPMIYSNECYRFGGLSNQRGFNEENFLATTKSINQIELRYLLDRNSSVFVFFDQSLYENRSNAGYRQDRPYGFGLGTNLGSKAGIFSLVYGLGVEKNNPLDLRTGKIHFGYIAYF
jgi:outer membrane protein assembly factor BamA